MTTEQFDMASRVLGIIALGWLLLGLGTLITSGVSYVAFEVINFIRRNWW